MGTKLQVPGEQTIAENLRYIVTEVFHRMRLPSLALIAGIAALGAASPALADSPAERAQLTRNALGCQDLYTARRYAQSLTACTLAASEFDRAAREQNNPWYAYYMKATMMQYAAEDNSALGRHREALRMAVASHQLARYVYVTYHNLDRDDYDNINELVAQLRRIEARERTYIQRGMGD